MATMTMGQHMLAKLLPPDAYQPGEVIDKKSINRILGTVAEKYPERYKETLSQLVSFGKDTAKSLGGGSFGVSDLATPPQAAARRQELEAQIRNILETVPPALRAKAIIQAVSAVQKDDASKLVAELEQQGNPLADILKGAGRGNPAALARLVASDLLYADANGDPVPIPILRSYSQGLSTGEYAASSFGARKGVVEAKVSVTAGGYSAKQTLAAAHRMVVTDDDGPEPDTIRGLPVDTGDEDNLGALLAADTGPYKRNTEITPKIAADLIKKGYDQILVRSPLTTADPMGGVYAKDLGYRAGHKLPRVGDSVGILAAGMFNEPVQQSVLSAKHKGGIATHTEGLTGFALIDKLLNPPKDFRDAAAYADVDGRIQEIRDAPQGGKYVTISGQRHYVPAGKELLAKLGDTVEAGDKLSEGPLNPHKVIEHKGLGEGARQLTFELRKALKDSNLYVNRRNVEPIVRGLVNRVELTEEYGDYLPGDVVPYNELANAYYPRDGAKETDLSSVVGRYLEKPVLHYSIGTRVTPKVVEQLRKFGVDRPITHEAPPPFKSTAVRAIDILKTDSDWMTQQIGTGLEKSLLTATHRSAVSDEAGSSFVAARARMTDFNRVGVVKNSPSSVLYRQPIPSPSGLLRIPPKPGQPQP